MFPTAGGPYYYKYYALKRLIPGMGEMIGFLTGWLFWICLIVGFSCMSCGLVNLLSASIWGSSDKSPLYFGPAVIVLLFGSTTLLNLRPIRQAAWINNIFSAAKLLMAIGFAALVIANPSSDISRVFMATSPSGCSNFLANISSVFMIALAGFAGLDFAGCTSSETKDAKKSVPTAIIWTLLTVTLIYVAVCIATAAAANYMLSPDKSTLLISGTNVHADCPGIAGYINGAGGKLFTAAIVASIIGCSFTGILGLARVSYSMAKTNLFPAQFAQVCSASGIPRYALWFQFFCLCLIAVSANLLSRTKLFPDAYTFLGETFGFMYAFLAIIYCICVVSLRYTDPAMERAFRIGKSGNLLVWIVALLNTGIWSYAAFFCVKLDHQIAGIFFLLSGLPIYLYYRQSNRAVTESNSSSS